MNEKPVAMDLTSLNLEAILNKWLDTTSEDLEIALKEWLNALLPFPLTSISALADGKLLWFILHKHIDPQYFPESLPLATQSSSEWIIKYNSLKTLEKETTTYIAEMCDVLPRLRNAWSADLTKAANGDKAQLLMLVKRVLLAAMYNPESSPVMIAVIQKLEYKQSIRNFFEEAETLNKTQKEAAEEGAGGSELEFDEDETQQHDAKAKRDPDLEREEKMIQMLKERQELKDELKEVTMELEESREKVVGLEEELADSRHALDRRRKGGVDDSDVAKLNYLAKQDREYIKDLEGDLETKTAAIEWLEKEVARFRVDSKAKQELSDEMQLVSAERDDLRQKVNANENLRKKIQSLQEQEKTNASLKHDIQMMQEELQELEYLREQCAALTKTNEENSRTIALVERENADRHHVRTALEHKLETMTISLRENADHLNRAQETIRELQERVGGVPMAGGEDNLDGELDAEEGTTIAEDSTDATAIAAAAGSKSKTSLTILENVKLTQDLSIANTKISSLEQRVLDLLQENVDLKSSLDKAEASPAVSDSHPTAQQERGALESSASSITVTSATGAVAVAVAGIGVSEKALRMQLEQSRRENRLMTSAWYNMSTRLQSNAVDLERRAEGSRTWLGRMRLAVNR